MAFGIAIRTARTTRSILNYGSSFSSRLSFKASAWSASHHFPSNSAFSGSFFQLNVLANSAGV